MKKTISLYDFENAFRYTRPGYFSYAGLTAMYNYFEEYEEDSGEEIELDTIAICCEYTEYENIEEFWGVYDKEDYPDIESIEYNTQVIGIDEDSFIILDFWGHNGLYNQSNNNYRIHTNNGNLFNNINDIRGQHEERNISDTFLAYERSDKRIKGKGGIRKQKYE